MLKKLGIVIIIVVAMAIIISLVIVLFGRHAVGSSHQAKRQVSLYQQQANKVCQQLQQAASLYQQQHVKRAYNTAENAYWNIYDNVLEIKYRSYATPATIFAVESQFHSLSAMMTMPVTQVKVRLVHQHVAALCQEVTKEAHFLTHHS